MRNSIMMLSLMLGYLLSSPLVELMKIVIDEFGSLSNIIGTYLKPEIRLLFIFNGIVILIVTSIIELKRQKIDDE
jgi:hypothetical protein